MRVAEDLLHAAMVVLDEPCHPENVFFAIMSVGYKGSI